MGSFLTDGIGLNLFRFEGVREFGNQASQREADFLFHSELQFENNSRNYRCHCQFRAVNLEAWLHGTIRRPNGVVQFGAVFFSYFTDFTERFS